MAAYDWYLPVGTYETVNQLLGQIQLAEEDSPEWHQAIDELQSLPGYPHQATVLDEVVPRLAITRRQ